MSTFRKKPVEVEAMQLRWDTWSEMCDFVGVGSLEDGNPTGTAHNKATGEAFESDGPGLLIPTSEGLMVACPMDWIIKGVAGEFYPCKPEIFQATYEKVEAA